MKRTLLLLAVLVLLLLTVNGTTAFFTAEKTAANVITFGDISVELLHTAFDENGPVSLPRGTAIIHPGDEISQTVQLKNTGSHPAHVRILLRFEADAAPGEDARALVSCDINEAFWTLRDGFYYYNEILPAGQVTQPLFNNVQFSTNIGARHQGSDIRVITQGFATQAEHNGQTPLDAVAWPEA